MLELLGSTVVSTSLLMLLIFATIVLAKKLSGLSLIIIVLGLNSVNGFLAYLSYGVAELHRLHAFSFYNLGWSREDVNLGISIFALSNIGIATGYFLSAMVSYVKQGGKDVMFSRLSEESSAKSLLRLVSPRLSPGLLSFFSIFLCVMGFAAAAASMGVMELFYRSEYLPVDNQIAFTFAQFILIIASLLGGVVLGQYRTAGTGSSFFAALSIVLSVMIYISFSSRLLAAVIPLAYFGSALAPGRELKLLPIFLSLATAFVLLPVPLYFRTLPSHGLLFYLSSIDSETLSALYFGDTPAFFSLLLNLGFGIPLTSLVWQVGSFSFMDFLVSINPFPGQLAGWYDIAQNLRVNEYIPYNMYGEIALLGVYAIPALIALGVLIYLIDSALLGKISSGNIFVVAIVLSLGVMFAVLSQQYNTRSALRMVYYSIFILASARLLRSSG